MQVSWHTSKHNSRNGSPCKLFLDVWKIKAKVRGQGRRRGSTFQSQILLNFSSAVIARLSLSALQAKSGRLNKRN